MFLSGNDWLRLHFLKPGTGAGNYSGRLADTHQAHGGKQHDLLSYFSLASSGIPVLA
jgi:hypothetical protein